MAGGKSIAAVKKTAKTVTVRKMKKLGVYKPEYDTVIEIYVGLTAQYDALNQRFEEDGYPTEVPCGEIGRAHV